MPITHSDTDDLGQIPPAFPRLMIQNGRRRWTHDFGLRRHHRLL
jgi:hypothetical protein